MTQLNSVIGDKVERIQELLEDGNLEAAGSSIHTVLLQTLVDVIPQAEDYIRSENAKKGVYQLNALTSMILEVFNSARAMNDRGQIAEALVTRVIQPYFRDIAENIIREFMALEADLSTARSSEIPKVIKAARDRLSAAVQGSYNGIRSGIDEYMSG